MSIICIYLYIFAFLGYITLVVVLVQVRVRRDENPQNHRCCLKNQKEVRYVRMCDTFEHQVLFCEVISNHTERNVFRDTLRALYRLRVPRFRIAGAGSSSADLSVASTACFRAERNQTTNICARNNR